MSKRAAHWKDLTPDAKKRRMAWTRGGRMPLTAPDMVVIQRDPEAQRIAEAIRVRVRAQRVAAGRL